jgi:hypothetical protein
VPGRYGLASVATAFLCVILGEWEANHAIDVVQVSGEMFVDTLYQEV